VDGQTVGNQMPVPAPRTRVLSDDEDLDDDDEEEDEEDPGVCHRRRREPSPGPSRDSDSETSTDGERGVDKVDGDVIPPPVDLGQFRVMDMQGSQQSLNEVSCGIRKFVYPNFFILLFILFFKLGVADVRRFFFKIAAPL